MSADWLAQLAPAHAPAPPGWWPPAPGWWAAAVLLVGVGLAAFKLGRWWREPRRRYRRAALRELQRIRESGLQGAPAAQAIENLLRRYAVALYGKERVARLTGAAWLEFAGAAGAEQLAGNTGRSLLAAAFGDRAGADPEGWFVAAAEFIRCAPGASRAPQ